MNIGNVTPSLDKFSIRIMIGLWLLMMVVLINAFGGTLTSFLTSPKFEPTIESFEQLVDRNKTLITEKGAYEEIFLVGYTHIHRLNK